MIYINDDSQYILVPKIVDGIPVKLLFRNQLTGAEITKSVTDLTPTKTFYKFELGDLTVFTEGQYDLSVLDDEDEVLATAILQFGEYVVTPEEYESSNNTITYNG